MRILCRIGRLNLCGRSMFSRSMRIVAVFLSLAQLVVWGVVAPVHRLNHHSHLAAAKPDQTTCHSHCCSHHKLGKSPQQSSDHPTDESNAPDRCPHDDNHCGLCTIALQPGRAADVVEVTSAVVRVASLVEVAEVVAFSECARSFDSRGPPKV